MVKHRRKMKVRRHNVEIKKVVIAPTEIIRITAPPGVIPVVAVDPVKRIVEVVPVTKAKKLSWWKSIFR